MNTSKKWMVSLSDELHAWVKEIAEEAEIAGSAVIEEALSLARNNKEFKPSLIEAKTKIKLDSLLQRKSTLEEEIRALRQVTNGRGIRVPA